MAGSGPSATTRRSRDRWTAMYSTRVAGVPVRVQHRSGVMWTLNSAGLASRARRSSRRQAAQRRPQLVGHLPRDESGSPGSPPARRVRRNRSDRRDTGFDVSDIVNLSVAHRQGELAQRVHCLAPGKRILHDAGSTSTSSPHGWPIATTMSPGRGALRDPRPTGRRAGRAAGGGRPPAGPNRTRRRRARRQGRRPGGPRGHGRDPTQLRRRARRPVPDRRPRRRTA